MAQPLRILAGLAAAIGWIVLGVQFGLILQATGARGLPNLAAVFVALSFFTIEVNVLAALALTAAAAGREWRARESGVHAALCVYLLTAGAIFAFVLRRYWDHRGLQFAADVALHYVTPVLYAAFWLLAVPKHGLRWRDPLYWLIYPALYLGAVLLFARWTGFYPYPIIDAPAIGLAELAVNALALCAAFLAVGLAVVGVSRLVDPAR